MSEEHTVVKAKPLPKKPIEDEIEETLFVFCHHYPAYTLQAAAELPYHQVLRMLETTRKEQAANYMELLNISVAPHTKKGAGVKKLSSHYKQVING